MTKEDELLEIVKKLEPVLGEQVKALWYLYLNKTDEKKKRAIERQIVLLGELTLKLFEEPILLKPPRTEGGIHLGDILYRDEKVDNFTISSEDLVRHTGILGATGVGKTNILLILINQLFKRDIPFIFFDIKQNFRHLLTKTEFKGKLKISVLGTNIGQFKDNHLAFPEHPILPRKLWALMWANFVFELAYVCAED